MAIVVTIAIQIYSLGRTLRRDDRARGLFIIEQLHGTVTEPFTRYQANAIRFEINDKSYGRVLLSAADLPWLDTGHLSFGDELSATARLFVLAPPTTLKDEFTYQAQLYRRGYSAYGKIISLPTVTNHHHRQQTFTDRFATELLARFGRSEALAVILTLSLGKSNLLSRELNNTFRDTGLSHLLVVSGFHIVVVYLLVFKATSWTYSRSTQLLQKKPRKYFCSIVALLASFAYAYLVSAGIATLRALVALAVVVIGGFVRGAPSPMTLFLSVMLAMLWLWPYSFCEASFQLTFAAVLGLAVAATISKSFRFTGWQLKCATSACFCTIVWLFTSPVVAVWFGSFVPLSAVFNLLVIPLFSSLGITFGLISTVLCLFHLFGASLIMQLNIWIVDEMLALIEWLDETSGALGFGSVQIPSEQLGWVLCVMFFALLVTSGVALWITFKKGFGVVGTVC